MNCMLAAYSFCTGIPIPDLIKMLGRDLSASIKPGDPGYEVAEFAAILYPLEWRAVHLYGVDISKYLTNKEDYNFVAHGDTHCIGYKYGATNGHLNKIDGIVLLD